MNGSGLGKFTVGSLERFAGIEKARLVVAPDTQGRAALRDASEDRRRECLATGFAIRVRELGTADAQIEHSRLRVPWIGIDHRGKLARVSLQPGADRRTRRAWWQPAGVPQHVACEPWVDGREAFQGFPGRALAHGEVGVRGFRPASARGDTHAHRQSGAGEREQDLELRLVEGKRLVISGYDAGGSRQRIPLVEHRIRHGGGRIGDGPTLHHVAEIDEPGDGTRLRAGGIDEHVVVIGIVVDDTTSQPRQSRGDERLPQLEDVSDDRPVMRRLHCVQLRADDVGSARRIPREIP